MKYVINRENYKKFPLFEVNKCEGRAYFIPYSNRETLAATSCLEERYKSDLVTVLSGEWDFHYYDKVSKLPQPLDTDVEPSTVFKCHPIGNAQAMSRHSMLISVINSPASHRKSRRISPWAFIAKSSRSKR